MATVSIHNVTKNYDATPVLRGINLDIKDGEFLVLVGPSGCGKSTLLRMVAGLEDITSGEIRIDGVRVNERAPKDRDIAMVFQNYALYPHMTVAENLSFALRLRSMSDAEMERRTSSAAEILGLTPLLARYPRQLSGGQRQRVAMGRAIVREPKAFLFDEPLSNLDAKLRVSMRAEIKTLQQRLSTTSIYVTHDQAEAMTMADRIVVMHDGIIEQLGSPLDLYDQPVNRFVAGFIGSPAMNFLNATVRAESNLKSKFCADLGPSGQLPLISQASAGLKEGAPLELGIRPEHLSIDPQGTLLGRVVVVEPTGLDTLIYLQCEGQSVKICALLRERVHLRPGDTVRLCATHSFLVFDPVTGKNMAT